MLDYTLSCDTWPGLAKLQEETGELNTVLGKIVSNRGSLMYWDDKYLMPDLLDELADNQATLVYFMTKNNLDIGYIMQRTQEKLQLYEEWAATGQ